MIRAAILSLTILLAACESNDAPGPSAADEARAKNAEDARKLREAMGKVKAPKLPAADAGIGAGIDAEAY